MRRKGSCGGLTKEMQVFLKLFGEALKTEKSRNMTLTGMDSQSWKKVADLSALHHVLPMIWNQINGQPLMSELGEQLCRAWRMKAVSEILMQERRTSVFLHVYKKFWAQGLRPVVVKGMILREIFPQPDYRSSSDEDIWIDSTCLPAYEDILEQEGYIRKLLAEDVAVYVHQDTGFHLEVHLGGFQIGDDGLLLQKIFEGYESRCIDVNVSGVTVRTLGHTDHMIYLISHDLKHFCGSGLGIRQIADTGLYAQSYGDQIDWQHIFGWSVENGIYKFIQVLMKAAGQLGIQSLYATVFLDTQEDRNPVIYEFIRDCLEGGIYGKSSMDRIYGGTMLRERLKNPDMSKGGAMWRRIFVPTEYAQVHYPFVKERPYLLPIAWVIRFIKYICRMRKNRMSLLLPVKTGSKRFELASRMEIERFREVRR
ncbi:MAG: nucleotidyltransferase family protein [Catenibacillus sp.]